MAPQRAAQLAMPLFVWIILSGRFPMPHAGMPVVIPVALYWGGPAVGIARTA